MYTDKRPAKYLAVLLTLTLLVPLVVVAALIWIAASILFRSLILIIAWLAWSWQGKDLLIIYFELVKSVKMATDLAQNDPVFSIQRGKGL
jgi:hypothetical protein